MVSEEFKEFKEFRSSGVQEFRSSGVQEFRSSMGGLARGRTGLQAKMITLMGSRSPVHGLRPIGQVMSFELFGRGVENACLLNSLNSHCLHGSLADLEPSKDRTVCLYRERMQESDGRRPF
jgi:hypothetical protein